MPTASRVRSRRPSTAANSTAAPATPSTHVPVDPGHGGRLRASRIPPRAAVARVRGALTNASLPW